MSIAAQRAVCRVFKRQSHPCTDQKNVVFMAFNQFQIRLTEMMTFTTINRPSAQSPARAACNRIGLVYLCRTCADKNRTRPSQPPLPCKKEQQVDHQTQIVDTRQRTRCLSGLTLEREAKTGHHVFFIPICRLPVSRHGPL